MRVVLQLKDNLRVCECGAIPELIKHNGVVIQYQIKCPSCGMRSKKGVTKDVVIAGWNMLLINKSIRKKNSSVIGEQILKDIEGDMTFNFNCYPLSGNKYGFFKAKLRNGIIGTRTCPVCGNDYFLTIDRASRRKYLWKIENMSEKFATETLCMCSECGLVSEIIVSSKSSELAIIDTTLAFNHLLFADEWFKRYEYNELNSRLYHCPRCNKVAKWSYLSEHNNKDVYINVGDGELKKASEIWMCDCFKDPIMAICEDDVYPYIFTAIFPNEKSIPNDIGEIVRNVHEIR